MKLTRAEIAYHEAGHAVIALAFGHGIEDVRIVSESEGHTVMHLLDPTSPLTPHNRRRIRNDIISLIAGSVAGLRVNPKGKDYALGYFEHPTEGQVAMDGSDIVSISKRIERLTGSVKSKRAAKLYVSLTMRTYQMVHKHWARIERVAAALMKTGSLTDIEVETLAFPRRRP